MTSTTNELIFWACIAYVLATIWIFDRSNHA